MKLFDLPIPRWEKGKGRFKYADWLDWEACTMNLSPSRSVRTHLNEACGAGEGMAWSVWTRDLRKKLSFAKLL